MRSISRIAAIATVVAIVISPLVATSASAAVPQITGTPRSTAWIDPTVNAEATVNTAYSSTLQGPNDGGPFAVTIEDGPAWLSASIDQVTQIITLSGTPTTAAASVSFTVRLSASNGENTYYLDFEGFTVKPNTLPTTTTVTSDTFSPYGSVNLQASVNAGFGGSVEFFLNTVSVGTVPLLAVGTASYTGAVPESLVGQSYTVTAVYSGDAYWAPSTSTSDPSVYIYGDRVVSGYFVRNGVGTAGEHIRLLTPANLPTSYSAVTGVAGYFEITLAAPTSLSDATATYVVEAADSGYFHSSAIAAGLESPTTFVAATATGDADWSEWVNIYEYRDPTWTDQTLSQPRLGESYADGVTANPQGSGSITYTATGDLPSWVTLSSTTGDLTSTGPTDQDAHTFTLRATSDFGYIEKQFTLQAGNAAVPPTFTDMTIADLQVGTPLTDEITATGDATITYSSTALPPGLVLDPSSGELTGTPTTAGEYVVTFTASNGVNPDATFTWEPTIKAAPEIDLVLNFAAGATVGDADTEIGAAGLKVNSTYTLYMHSTPRLLYTGTVDSTGAFSHVITLPADTPVGAHELILTGIAPDGTVMTAHAWFTLLPNGRIGAISYAGPFAFSLLPYMGSEPLLPLGIASALLVAGYLTIRRSRAVRVA